MMRKYSRVWILLLIAVVFFFAGYGVNRLGGNHQTEARKVLYYVDPMNPAFKSDKPGIAPCGMPLEPVYADQNDLGGGSEARTALPPGTVRISPEKQQLIGVKTATVEKTPWTHTVRVLGRVTPDEARVYRVNAAINGWIETVSPATTGSLVKKDELLATFYSLEYRSLVQNYFNLTASRPSGSLDGQAESAKTRPSVTQLKQMRDVLRGTGQGAEGSQVEYYKRNLFNYGISEYQLKEMERTRVIPDTVDIRAPIAGFVLSRNVSPGLRFDRGAEFFRIADLSRVWILADVFENEATLFKPGAKVKVELPYQKKILSAQVSNILPQFDPATRTLKVRLVANNPGFVMRPDMFVNVDLPVSGPAAITVPVDAVLDSGLKKTVFVDRGSGYFEPRQVETGRALGERIEIVRGLMPDEKIVVSGNFLIDSEARLQQAATGITGKIGRDPVCRMNIDEDRSRAEGFVREYGGKSYFFCSRECLEDFGKEPKRYLESSPGKGTTPTYAPKEAPTKHSAHGGSEHGAMAKPKPQDMKRMSKSRRGMSMPHSEGSERPPGAPGAPPMAEMPPPTNAAPAVRMPGSQNPSPVPAPKGPGLSPPMFAPPANMIPTLQGSSPAPALKDRGMTPSMTMPPSPGPSPGPAVKGPGMIAPTPAKQDKPSTSNPEGDHSHD